MQRQNSCVLGSQLGYSCLIRLKSDRKLYRPGGVRVHKRGPLPKHGPLFQGKRQETHGTPDEIYEEKDKKGRTIQTRRWQNLHFREDPDLLLSVFAVERGAARGTKRDPRTSFFVMLGTPFGIAEVASCYCLRFSIEHCYRFGQQNLRLPHGSTFIPLSNSIVGLGRIVSVFNQLCEGRRLGTSCLSPVGSLSRPVTPRAGFGG